MSPEAQRIAIAEACGWKQHPYNRAYGSIGGDSAATGNPAVIWPDRLPDYLNDLNAMHAAELVLNWDEQASTQLFNYRCALTKVCGNDRDLIPFASAWQRAEALLKTLGKWDGTK